MTAGDIKLHGYVTESGPGCNRESQCQPVLVIGSGSVRRHLVCSDHIGAKYGDVSGAGQRLRDVTNCRTAAVGAGASGRSHEARPEVRGERAASD